MRTLHLTQFQMPMGWHGAEETLRRRFAEGAIDEEEYVRRFAVLR